MTLPRPRPPARSNPSPASPSRGANPFSCNPLHKKASLAVLTDERNAGLFTPGQQAAIAKHIPWTRVMESRTTRGPDGGEIDLVPWAAQNKDRLVLKPNDDYGGKGIVLGWLVAQGAWDEAVRVFLAGYGPTD